MNAPAHAPRILAIVQAKRLASSPYAGSFRLIDVPLSNLRNSGISDVWIREQQEPSTEDMSEAISQHRADAVLLLGVGAVYRLDYVAVISEHLRRDADCTIVTTEASDATVQRAVVRADHSGRVERVHLLPAVRPTTVATDVLVFRRECLVESLTEILQHGDRALARLSALIGRGGVYAYPMSGIWRDLGRPETYLAAHRELAAGEQGLFDGDWPLTATSARRLPARLGFGCSVTDSMISDGCEISGAVRNSVLGPGVTVEPGGQVRDSVLFADVIIRSGATIDWTIVGNRCEIGNGAKVGSGNPREVIDPGHVAVLGADCRIEPGARVRPGARVEPGSRVE